MNLQKKEFEAFIKDDASNSPPAHNYKRTKLEQVDILVCFIDSLRGDFQLILHTPNILAFAFGMALAGPKNRTNSFVDITSRSRVGFR